MSTEQQEPVDPDGSKRSRSDRHSDAWIDETMAEGDIANGEGDPNELPQIRQSQKQTGDVDES
jgi:hypothetical protein